MSSSSGAAAAATEVLVALRVAMFEAASGNDTAAVAPAITEAAARARTELVHRVQRSAYASGNPEAAERILALTALLDCVLHRIEDVDRGVPLLNPAVAGAARRLLIDAG